MADRYRFTLRNQDPNTKNRKYDTTLYPQIKSSDDDIYIITNIGDRLDLLADRYYGDVTMWWIIAQANHIGKGTLNIKPGTNIRIPQNLEKIYSNLETLNRTR